MSAVVLIESILSLPLEEHKDVLKSYEFSDVEAAQKFIDDLNAIPKGTTAFNRINAVISDDPTHRADYHYVVESDEDVPLVLHCLIVNIGNVIEYDGVDVLSKSEVLGYQKKGIHPSVVNAYLYPATIEPAVIQDEDGNPVLPEFDDEYDFYMSFDPDIAAQVQGIITEREQVSLGAK